MLAVYVDDYILAAVESPDGSALQRTGRAALHTIHGLFPPPARSDHVNAKDPIFLKKLEAGDARSAPSKELLGFVFDGQSRTVHLTQRKALGITEPITRLLKKTRGPEPKFQSVVGKMRHVVSVHILSLTLCYRLLRTVYCIYSSLSRYRPTRTDYCTSLRQCRLALLSQL
jgi:hypothetical protein